MKLLAWLITAGCFISCMATDVTKGNLGAARPDEPAPKVEQSGEAKEKRPSYPFYGTLDSVNPAEKTITLKGKKKNRVILVTKDTRILKGNKSAKVQDGISGERVSGSVRKNSEGREEAITIRFGPKPTGG